MPKFKVNYTRYGKQESVVLEATNESDAFDEMFDMSSQGELGVTEETDPWLEELEDAKPVYLRYYVEYFPWPKSKEHIRSLYMYAYSPEQVRAMMADYELLTIDQTD